MDKVYKNSIDCARKIIKQHGVRNGLYKGFIITLYREFFLYSAYFAAYEMLKNMQETPSTLWLLFCGGIGGMSGWVGAFHIDNVKSRI